MQVKQEPYLEDEGDYNSIDWMEFVCIFLTACQGEKKGKTLTDKVFKVLKEKVAVIFNTSEVNKQSVSKRKKDRIKDKQPFLMLPSLNQEENEDKD
jgi:hypothetical protein